MCIPGYFAPMVVAPGRAPAVRPAPRRRRGPLVLAGLAALLLGATLAVRLTAPAPLAEVSPVADPAPAAAGWGPTWRDTLGRPARWDPCTPVRYVVNTGWMPEAGRRDLAEALRRLSAASGLRFADGGDTAEVPSSNRAAWQPGTYGDGWAPLLVAWVPPGRTDLALGDGVQGLSQSVAVPGRDGPHLVSGQVALDAGHRLAFGFGPGLTEGEVLLHELAHAVGLGHVLDPTQVMYPQATNSDSAFGAGDRAGLAALGAAAGCHAPPRPQDVRGLGA